MGVLPAGTVTLLLADIEGSTRLWEQCPTDMPPALAVLDDIVVDLVEQHNGVRPVEQGEGDSFVVAFALASDAVACALALQRATQSGMLRLRMGLHTGEIQLRDANNYMGPAINRAARIRDLGHGGQVLVSQSTVDIVQDDLPDGASLVDLGTNRLRDVGRPMHIWQLAHPELGAVFPPLRGLDVGRHNLPHQLTSFVGRAGAVAELDELLEGERAVTVTGAGGCGKTRLALRVAGDRLDRYPGGVWLVDFAPVNDPGAVAALVSSVVGAAPGGRDAVAAIVAAVEDAPTLLVLDNCEHLVPQCAELVEALLRASASISVLATSREPLGFGGETTFRVPSLTAPPADSTDAAAALRQFEAVELFVQRAAQARRGGGIDQVDTGVIAEICRRLDGMPLAIELAAARMRVLTAEQIRDGLHDRFRLLTGGARTAMPRQQTLQASVDWSYALLLGPERILLHRLSVFAGGFSLEAAVEVGSGGELEAHHVFDLLMQLVDKSLVFTGDDARGGRFGLLETVRQYAASKLVDSGEADEVRRRHFDYFFEFARRGDASLEDYRRRLDADYDNLRRALQWADDHADPDRLVRMAAHLYGYWALGRRLGEGDSWLRRAVDRADSPRLRGRVLGHFAHIHGMAVSWAEAVPYSEEALGLARDSGNASAVVWSLAQFANALSNVLRMDECLDALHEAIDIARAHDDVHGLAFATFQLGRVQTVVDPLAATATLTEAEALGDRAGAAYIRHMATACRGWAAEAVGDLGGAAAYTEQGVAGLVGIGDGWFLSSILAFMAHTKALAGDTEGAEDALEHLAAVETEMGGAVRPMVALGRGLVASTLGDWDSAVAYLSELHSPIDSLIASVPLGLSLLQTGGPPALAPFVADTERPDAYSQRSLQIARGELALATGDSGAARDFFRAFLVDDAPMLYGTVFGVHALRRFAGTSLRAGQADEAVRLLAAATARAEAIGMSLSTALVRLTDDERVAAEEAVDPGDFARLWSEGAVMTWPDVLAYVARGRGQRRRPASGWDSLTPTERQVVDLVRAGMANKAIGEKLFMSLATVKSHLSHAYAKLGVASRAELLAGEIASRHSAS